MPCVSELGRAFKNNQPHHYTIIKKSNCSDFQSFIKDLEERYQIEVLLVDEYDEISDILKEINYFTNQKMFLYQVLINTIMKINWLKLIIFVKINSKPLQKWIHYNKWLWL